MFLEIPDRRLKKHQSLAVVLVKLLLLFLWQALIFIINLLAGAIGSNLFLKVLFHRQFCFDCFQHAEAFFRLFMCGIDCII